VLKASSLTKDAVCRQVVTNANLVTLATAVVTRPIMFSGRSRHYIERVLIHTHIAMAVNDVIIKLGLSGAFAVAGAIGIDDDYFLAGTTVDDAVMVAGKTLDISSLLLFRVIPADHMVTYSHAASASNTGVMSIILETRPLDDDPLEAKANA
jgi:hypothetical protein